MKNIAPGGAPVNYSDLLTADEVGLRLRLPRSTVYHLAKSGELPAVRFGRSWRFPEAAIERLRGGGPMSRVLVVDDDVVTRSLVASVLQPLNCLVYEADGVGSALAQCGRQRFDVLFVDLRMPGRDGGELLRALLDQYSLNQMIVITAHPDAAQTSALLELGPVTLLRKPLAGRQLIECVERVLGHRLSPARAWTAPEAISAGVV